MTKEEGGAPRGAFFGRRKGKPLRDRQAELMDVLLPRLRVPRESQIERPEDLFPAPVDDIWLEIGFGGGEHLASQAANHPSTGFIGCEPFINGMAKLLGRVEDDALNNIRVHDTDALTLLPLLPENSIGRAFILYPDPWPKRRHRKRRIVSDESLSMLARIMKPGAVLRFASDIDDYVAWTLARILRSPDFVWQAEAADDWRLPWPDWPGTRYEAKALREGRPPSYITAIRKP